MHIHILGICGTFMGSLAILAREAGHRVTGSDQNVYPPMSTQLEMQGIELIQGYDPVQLKPAPDLVIVGNAMSRGNPVWSTCWNRGCLILLDRSGCMIICFPAAGCWRLPEHMVKRRQQLCWPGYWISRYGARLFDWWCPAGL